MISLSHYRYADSGFSPGTIARFALLILCGAMLVGCGKRYATIPVYGHVTFNGGPMPAAGTLYFAPTETTAGQPMRAASADFKTDGKYSVSSFAKVEGLFPGTYEVLLHCWKVPPTVDGPRAVSHLPIKYGSAKTSELKLTVAEGSSGEEFNIDVKSGH